MAKSTVTRKQVYTVLTSNADALKPLFEGAGVNADAAIEVLNKALAAASKTAPAPRRRASSPPTSALHTRSRERLTPTRCLFPLRFLTLTRSCVPRKRLPL